MPKSQTEIVLIPNHLEHAWTAYMDTRRLKRASTAASTQNLLLKKLQKMSEDPFVQAGIVEQSVERGWQGLFPVREDFFHMQNQGGPVR